MCAFNINRIAPICAYKSLRRFAFRNQWKFSLHIGNGLLFKKAFMHSVRRPVSSYANITISDVSLNMTSRYVTVSCSDETKHSFPFVWLRDNCQCDRCFNPITASRSLLLEDLDPNVSPQNFKSNPVTNSVDIMWNDGHRSRFPVEWLLERSFNDCARKRRKAFYQIKPKFWDSSFKVPTDDYTKVLTDDTALYQWIRHLSETGMFLLTNTPQDTTAVYRLAERIAFLKKTNYGEHFIVESKEGPTNLAYTNVKLGLHTDLPYYKYQPGVQLLHCLEQCDGDGGENTFADGCHVSKLLRGRNPEDFNILTRILIDYENEGTDYYKFHKFQQTPIIVLDYHGNVERIPFNQIARASFMSIPLEEVYPFYRAFKHFDNILCDPKNVFRIKLKSGEMICFNNQRVLHGREAFTVTSGNRRFYMGGYIDWDEVNSRMRVLRKELCIDYESEN